tara:strand:+ start:207 stop:458 length:252 start_codon:yes stop_codon:yes gene_type:complete
VLNNKKTRPDKLKKGLDKGRKVNRYRHSKQEKGQGKRRLDLDFLLNSKRMLLGKLKKGLDKEQRVKRYRHSRQGREPSKKQLG